MDDRDWQTPEELAAIRAPGGPVMAASEWLAAAIVDGDLAAVWEWTEPNLRLCMAQGWVWLNRQHHAVEAAGPDCEMTAAELADKGPAHSLWSLFAAHIVTEIRGWGVDFDTSWGWLSRPRPIAPDLELLKLIERGDHELVFDGHTEVYGFQFIMRHTPQGWLLAATSGELPVPGWPPSLPSA